jgi:hypothetical protein
MRSETLPASMVGTMASWWMRLNYLRDALALVGWLLAFKTFSLPM